MINKHKNVCVGVYWNDISVPGLKLSGWVNNVECRVVGGKEGGDFLFLCFILHGLMHFSVWCHDSLDFMHKLSEIFNLKEMIDGIICDYQHICYV